MNSGASELDDGFDVLMRRQGWHLTGTAPVQGGNKAVEWRTKFSNVSPADKASFYQAFGGKAVRKLIRSILLRPQGIDELAKICPNEEKLASILVYLQAGGIVIKTSDGWSRGPNCNRAENIGPTFEWYVAEWFRRELKSPARHGVHVDEMPNGGDLDVVAFVGEMRVWVECKTSRPDEISDDHLKRFLQRAFDFRPEIAVLLVDTESPVAKLAQGVRNIWNRMSSLSHGTPPSVPAKKEAEPIPGYSGIHWCAQHVFVANVAHSVDRSLSNIVRFHETYAKRQIFVPTVGKWDFESETVQGETDTKGPYMVEGMLWIEV